MKFVLAPDSFKESMSASHAVAAMRAGILSAWPDAECIGVPMADGGEGTVDAVVDALGGERITVDVADPLGFPVTATYGYVGTRRLAVIEMAAAAGIELVPAQHRDVLRASTYGVGQLIASALDRGAANILVGLGGSATNDGGAGMLTALGAELTDEDGARLPPGGAALRDLRRIDLAALDPRLSSTQFQVACDVTAPLLGSVGASEVFGPQKGATACDVALLDEALARFATVTSATLGHAHPDRAGAGAAGGLGFAMAEYLSAEARPGVEIIAETVDLDHWIAGADWVFTGEGSVDAQTVLGKTPYGVARIAQRHDKPVVIFAGRVAEDASILLQHGVTEIIGITADGTPIAQALCDGPDALTRAAADVVRRLRS